MKEKDKKFSYEEFLIGLGLLTLGISFLLP
jgi:hypothetical protein